MIAPVTIQPSRCKLTFTFDDTPFVREHILSRTWVYSSYGHFFGVCDGKEHIDTTFEALFLGTDADRFRLHFLNGDRTDFREHNLQKISNGQKFLGDSREDGMVFWEYSRLVPGGEYWISAERFRELFFRMGSINWTVRRGDVNADGKICTSISRLGKPTWTSLASWDKTQAKKKKSIKNPLPTVNP
jgi:hypothetical protein